MEETICNIEIVKTPKQYVAKIQTELGGLREYRSEDFEEILEQIVMDLQEEFEE